MPVQVLRTAREGLTEPGRRGRFVLAGTMALALSTSAAGPASAFPDRESPVGSRDEAAQPSPETTASPANLDSQAGRDHWAFQPLRRPEVPAVRNANWIRTPIDAFILARLEAAGLEPAAPASRLDLIRRATYDLTGLPPTRAEVEAFLADESPTAYEQLIDRLLASPHYGERWGRHWLDLARYADSNGFEFDEDRPHAFRYRDYVIRSFNADKPYDRMILEQLAGDELAPQNPEALIATGFCRNGPVVASQQNEKLRLDELDDIVSTTSSVFLGLTIGCARCHDHKSDPIPQEDYYRLLAIFNSREKRDIPVPTPREMANYIRATARIDLDIERLRQQLIELTDAAPSDGDSAKAEIEEQLRQLEASRPQLPRAMAIQDAGPHPRKTFLLHNGDHRTPGPEVSPGIPAVLATEPVSFPEPTPDSRSTGRRSVLARWIASPANPLTARVIVNRVWQSHFGRGIVATPSDFGRDGSPPTHPALLDWLAAEFITDGWQFKRLHRRIMTSAVYRQGTQFSPPAAANDPANALLWRFSPRRLSAEEIRDSILAASGNLNRSMYGPGIRPRIDPGVIATGSTRKWPTVEKEGPEHWRRSIYIFIKRSVPMPLLEVFDAPGSSQSCERRLTTTVPTQALQLMNSPFTNEQADLMAARILTTAGDAADEQAETVYWCTLSRPPRASERATAIKFLQQQRDWHASAGHENPHRAALADLCHVMFNLNEFVYVN